MSYFRSSDEVLGDKAVDAVQELIGRLIAANGGIDERDEMIATLVAEIERLKLEVEEWKETARVSEAEMYDYFNLYMDSTE